MITAEQARAELERRARAKTSGITPGQAQAELDRRASKGVEPSIMQQLFDVKNSKTGESYLYGNTPPPAPYEDLQRTVGDTVSRGYLDKLRGPGEQAKTAAARERMPDWAEVPTDIAAYGATAPYRIGGTLAGAGFGALEGAASAYGHQNDWMPSLGEAGDIALGAGTGAVAGAGGAQLGKWGGDIYSKLAGKTVPNPQAGEKTALGKVADFVEPMALRQKRSMPLSKRVVTEAGLAHLGVPPAVTTGGASLLNWLGKGSVKGATMTDPAAGAAARDALAKMMIGMEK